MRYSALLPFAALFLGTLGVCAQPAAIDAARLLPPPPLPGSAKDLAELGELHHLQATSTPEQLAAAAYDDRHEDGTIFATVLGPNFDLAKLPATAALLKAISKAEDAATKVPKGFFHRPRPWIADASIKTCTPHKSGPALNSYPSGHSTVGFAMAEVMAALVPDKAQPLLARAAVFAENRLVCGYHFRSDIVAGQELGTVLALRLMGDTGFQTQMEAARRELQAANLTP